jgi:CPA1 family monovalent cation:H+ antiporter
MSLFTVFAILITLTALFSYINERYIRFPATIGAMVASLTSSILIIILGLFGFGSAGWAKSLVETVDFNALLMKGMLSFLLFAGASRVNISDLLEHKWSISYLATVGIVVSTFLTGTAVWWLFDLLGIEISYLYSLLLGALISPTDAVSVLGVLKRARTSKSLETIITGEALFNDAVAVVIFILIMGMVVDGHRMSMPEVGRFFLEEGVGGVAYGLILGYLSHLMISRIDNYIVVVLITLAVVSGGYALADILNISGPLTMVVAGLFFAKRRHILHSKHSEQTLENVRNFWDVVDDVLNAVLFVLIGLELLVLDIEIPFLLAGLLTIPLIILTRLVSVGMPLFILSLKRKLPLFSTVVMTWGGLRGGVSIALALSLPDSQERELILTVTYVVVVFSILVQGLTLERIVKLRRHQVET